MTFGNRMDGAFGTFMIGRPLNISSELAEFNANKYLKVVLYNNDVTAISSVIKCKQSCLIDHLLHS